MRTLLVLLILALPAFCQEASLQGASVGDGAAVNRENQWPTYVAIMAELSPFVAEANAADRDAWREDNDWGGAGFSAMFWQPSSGLLEHYNAERARIERVLDDWESRGAFEHTAKLARLQMAVPPPYDLNDPPPFALGDLHVLKRAEIARMHLAARRGDTKTRLIAFEELLAMHGLHVRHERIMGWLVAKDGVRDGCVELLRTHLSEPMLDAEAIVRADRAIQREAVDGWITPEGVNAMLRNDLLEIIRHTYTDDGAGDGAFVRDVYEEMMRGGPRRVELDDYDGPYASRREALAWVDEFSTKVSAMLATTGQGYLDAKRAVQQHIDDAVPALPVAGDFGEVHVYVAERERVLAALVAGTRVVLAIECYRLAHEGKPLVALADLGQLLPESLRTDPLSGEPWTYTTEKMRTDEYGQPLLAGAIVWPYTLSATGLPGLEPPWDYAHVANGGLLITPPIQGPEFDPNDTEGN